MRIYCTLQPCNKMGVPKANKMIYWKCAARSSAAGRQMQPVVRLLLLRGTRCHCTALCAATAAIHFITRAAINASAIYGLFQCGVHLTLPPLLHEFTNVFPRLACEKEDSLPKR